MTKNAALVGQFERTVLNLREVLNKITPATPELYSGNPKGATPLSANVWHHLAVTSSGGVSKIYLNGTQTGPSGNGDSKTTTGLGLAYGNGDNYFAGSIDDLRIYNRSLSAAEVQSLYNLGGGAPPPTPTPTNGSCGTTLNSCSAGTLNDTTDSSTEYLWQCTGSNGGTTASCRFSKPEPPSSTPCANPSSQPQGTATPLPTLGVTPCSAQKSGGTLTLTLTPQSSYHHLYKRLYLSDPSWSCPGKVGSWCPIDVLPSGDWVSQTTNYAVPASTLSSLSTGTHHLLIFDWLWDQTAGCYKGPGLNQCNTGVWRLQQFEVK